MYTTHMKRFFTLLTLTLITLASISVKAQDKDKNYVKSYIDFYGGLSNPVGDFGKSDYSNNQAGYAKRGVVLSLDGAVYVYKNLAIGATLSFQDHGQLSYNDVLNLATGYTADYHADETDVTSNDRYHSFNILLGPQYSFTYHKLILDLRASAGIMKFYTTPNMQFDMTGVPTQTHTFYQLGTSPTILAYGGSAGLRYHFSDSWSVGVKAAYIDSQGLKISNTGKETSVGRLTTKIPVSMLQTTIGMTLNF